jgi:predicted Zn finger-like uncharacterized protein
MRIVCPSCEAAYDVPDTLVARRRTLRCARCGREWANESPADAPPAEAPASEAPASEAGVPKIPVPEVPAPEIAAPPQPQPPRVAATLSEALADQRVGQPPSRSPAAKIWLAWIASLALLAALGFAAWQYRADVMRVWPASERVYQALGLTEQ